MKCPCDPEKNFSDCCEPLLKGTQDAATPERLMRSRYSAFATRNLAYVVDTTDPQARVDMDVAGARQWMEESEFTKLEILRSTNEGNKGVVEFKASFTTKGENHIHHEVSKFRKHGSKWYFREGRVSAPQEKKN
jgi:SEC-C motif-containing protein